MAGVSRRRSCARTQRPVRDAWTASTVAGPWRPPMRRPVPTLGWRPITSDRTQRCSGPLLCCSAFTARSQLYAARMRLLAGISASAKGEPGWPPWRCSALAVGDVARLVGRAPGGSTGRSRRLPAVLRLRRHEPRRAHGLRPVPCRLVRRGLDRALFEAVTRQLDQRGVRGAQRHAGGCHTHSIRKHQVATRKHAGPGIRRRKPTHGYKAHVATDQDAGLIRAWWSRPPKSTMRRSWMRFCLDAPGDT